MFKIVSIIRRNFFSIIDIYFYKEIIPNYLFGIVFFTLVLSINELYYLAKYYIEYNVPLKFILILISNLIPFLLSYTIPISVLPSFLITLGRLSQESEFIAMKSVGISNLRIYRSGIIIGLFITIFAIYYQDNIMIYSNRNYLMMRSKIISERPAIELKEKSFISLKNFRINFQKIITEKDNDILYNVNIIDLEKKRKTIQAEYGKIFVNKENPEHYIIKLYNGNITEVSDAKNASGEVKEKFFISSFKYMLINVFIDMGSDYYYEKGPDTWTIKELKQEIDEQSKPTLQQMNVIRAEITNKKAQLKNFQKEIKQLKKIKTEDNEYKIKYYDNLIKEVNSRIRTLKNEMRNLRHNLPKYYIMKYYEKFALPSISFVFALLSLSIGIYTSRGRNEGLGLSVVLMLIFYGLKFGSEILISKGLFLPEAEWIPNIVLGSLAIILFLFKIKD